MDNSTPVTIPSTGVVQQSGTRTCPLLQNVFPLSCYADKTLKLSNTDPDRFRTWQYPTPEQVTETIRRDLDEMLIGYMPRQTMTAHEEREVLFCVAQRAGKSRLVQEQFQSQIQSIVNPTKTTTTSAKDK